MLELSLNILDIAQNSIKAKATRLEIDILEDFQDNLLTITIQDNGCGMSEEFLRNVTNPFTTTRTERKVGLGLPFFKQAAEDTGGSLTIKSEVGVGTSVIATFTHDHIDRQPLGDIAGTIFSIVSMNPMLALYYKHVVNGETFIFDTEEVRGVLGDVPLDSLDVLLWIQGYLNEGINNLYE